MWHAGIPSQIIRFVGRAAAATTVVSLIVVFVLAVQPVARTLAAGTLDQSQTTIGSVLAASGVNVGAQLFTAGLTGNLDQVDLYIERIAAPGDFVVEIRTVSGGTPSMTVIGTGTLAEADLPSPAAWTSIPLTTPAPVVAGTQYAIVAQAPSAVGANVSMWFAVADLYAGGNMLLGVGGFWSQFPVFDLAFRTYVSPPATATPTATQTSTVTPTSTVTTTATATASPTTTVIPQTQTPVPVTHTATPTQTPSPATATATVTVTATAPPVVQDDDDDDDDKKETKEQRQQRERTNDANLDEYQSEGNVAEVQQIGNELVITIALGRGEILVVVYQCRENTCPNIGYGDYVEVKGAMGDDGRFYAETLSR